MARLYFHNKGDPEIPYLTIDSEGNAILHVGVDVRVQLFGTKCEFLRQFEVAIPDEINRKIATLQIFNHDTGQMHEQAIRIGNKEDLDRNLAYSSRMISVEDLTGVHAGC